MPQETKYCHSSAIATFPFQGSGVEVVDESGTLWTWGGSAYLKPVGSRKDPITGLYELDEGSRGVVLRSIGYVMGLVSDDTAAGAANTAKLQAALNSRGDVRIPGGLGTVYFASSITSNDYGVLLLDDWTTLDIGKGTDLSAMPSPAVTIPLFCNRNARSNKLSVSSIVSTGQDAGSKYSIVEATIPGHTLTAGSFFQLKGDTTGYYNYVWEVQSVTPTKVTFHAMAYAQFPNGAGTIIAYPANAYITITGEGSLGGAYNLTNGTIGYVNLAMTLFNKVLACAYRVRTTKSYQRGCQFVNFYSCEAGSSDGIMNIESGAVGVQVTGPGVGIVIRGIRGGNADDKVALLTHDVTGAQFYDADGTLNSGGNIDSVLVHDVEDHGNSTRTIMLGADGGRFDNVQISNVHRVHRGNGNVVEAECTTGSSFGHLKLDDVKVTTHGKGGAMLSLTAGGGIYETITITDPVMRNAVQGSGYTGSCEMALVDLAANTSGTLHMLRIVRPSINADFVNSTNETSYVSGGNTSTWQVARIEVIDPDIQCNGTAGRSQLVGCGVSNNIDISIRGGELAGRTSQVVFASTGRTPTVRVSGTKISGFNYLIGGSGQSNVYLHGADVASMGSGQTGGIIGTYGVGSAGTHLTHSVYSGQTKFGETFVSGQLGAYTDLHFWSSGGNTSTEVTPFYNNANNDGGASNNNTYNLHGNCSDWKVNLDKIARSAGAIVQVQTAIGTILANELAVCSTSGAANSWKQLTDTTKVY